MLSVPHLIVIFVVALVVFGPEKLPDLARNIGKVMAEFRRATGDLKSTFEDHLREIERETNQRRINGPTAATPAAPPIRAPGAGNFPGNSNGSHNAPASDRRNRARQAPLGNKPLTQRLTQ